MEIYKRITFLVRDDIEERLTTYPCRGQLVMTQKNVAATCGSSPGLVSFNFWKLFTLPAVRRRQTAASEGSKLLAHAVNM